jgi:Flp pilus assembly protein TadD
VAVVLLLLAFATIVWDRARDWRDEEALYRQTLEYAPESARVRLNLGNLYLERGETERAAAQFAAGLTGHPNDSDLLTNAGLTWMSLGRFVAAEGALERVVELEPEDPQAWANLGALYGTTGRLDAARRAYGEALRRDRTNANAQSGLRILEELPP